MIRWILIVCFLCARPLVAADIRWDEEGERLSVDVRGVALEPFLSSLAHETGWRVFVEPGMQARVDVAFADKRPAAALRALGLPGQFSLITRLDGTTTAYFFERSRGAATQEIVDTTGTETTENDALGGEESSELVVRLDPDSGVSIEELAALLGGRVVGSIPGTNAYRLAFDDPESASEALSRLSEEEGVDSAEFNRVLPAPAFTPQPSPLGLPPIRLRPAETGDTVVIGLIDSVVYTENEDMKAFLLPQTTVVGDIERLEVDGLTHGSAMFETILRGMEASLEPGERELSVRVLPVDIYGNSDTTTTFQVAAAIAEAVNAGATTLNLSFGGQDSSSLVQDLIRESRALGVSFYGAAGNEPVETPTYPAAYDEVVAVTAADARGDLAAYANRGAFVDVIAPGSNIVSFAGGSFVTSGTSVAAAFLSGVAGANAAQTDWNIADVEAAVREEFRFEQESGE